MSPAFYHILHVVSVLVLFGYTFYAFAAPAETRKKVMMITGIASLVVLISAFGLISKVYGNNFQPWMFVKIAAWFGLSALAGFGYRKRGKARIWATLAVVFALLAVTMVYLKPTF